MPKQNSRRGFTGGGPETWDNDDRTPTHIENLELNDDIRLLFPSNLSDAEIKEKTLVAQRKVLRPQSDTIRPYMCVLRFAFLMPRMHLHPAFHSIMKSYNYKLDNIYLVDLGCCMGTDLRFLAKKFQIQPSSLIGLDYSQDFLEAGKDLFNDSAHAGGILFKQHDILSDMLPSITKKYIKIVHAGSFVHTFEKSKDIIKVCHKVFQMLAPGGCFFGSNRPDWIYGNPLLFKQLLEKIGFVKVLVNYRSKEELPSKADNIVVGDNWNGPTWYVCYKPTSSKSSTYSNGSCNL
jgi:SAM-dependent methyltransferase